MRLPFSDKLISRGIALLVFLLPLFFLPLTPDFYYFNKLVLLLVGPVLLLVLWLISNLASKRRLPEVKGLFTKTDLPVLAFLGVHLLSTFLNSHPMGAFYDNTGMIIGLTILYFLVKLVKPAVGLLEKALLATASLLAITTFYQAVGLSKALAPWVWMKEPGWTPAGTQLIVVSFFMVCLPLAVKLFRAGSKQEDLGALTQAFHFLPLIFIGVALLAAGLRLLNNLPPLLPLLANWQIAMEGFKDPKVLLVGVGPGNFVNVFTQAKPLYLNLTPVWNIIFTHGRSEYLHLLSTTGVVGLICFLWLILKAVGRSLSLKNFKPALLIILGLFIFLPGNLLLWLVLYLFLASKKEEVVSFREDLMRARFPEITSKIAHPLSYLGFAVLVVLLVGVIYLPVRAWQAERLTFLSAQAAAENRGRETYLLQQEVIRLNPYLDVYHLNFANTCFLIANSLAGRTDLTDEERGLILPLIQQAIVEANNATALAPLRASNWQFRGNLYRQLVYLAQGAGDWTMATLQRALQLDPANPRLRVDYGSLFYIAKNYDVAIDQFRLAVQVKGDYANGWYNLSAAYRDDGKYVQAVLAMQQVLNFLPEDSPDRPRAQSELEELQKKVAEMPEASPAPSKPQESLSLPEAPPATPSGLEPTVLPEPSPKPSPEAATEEEEEEASPSPSPESPF